MTWAIYLAQQGRELDRAEKLVRIAVEAEPDNHAFLDSLGWVMYKRGRFEPACEFLEKAIAQTINPDPVVLDHLGDACYRLGRQDDAIKRWDQARTGVEKIEKTLALRGLAPLPSDSDYVKVQRSVVLKLAAARAGRPAVTAAIVGPETPASKPAAEE